MGNCKSAAAYPPSRSRPGDGKLTLAILGLDNAGKTVTARNLQGAITTDVAPTIGYSSVTFSFGGREVILYDLGGGKNIRGIWHNYYAEVYGFVYVIDASDEARMDECRQVLSSFLKHDLVKGKPILLLANKQDVEGALDEGDICDRLELEALANYYQCPCRVETCSALSTGKGKKVKIDASIQNGFRWLVRTIDLKWTELHARITKDIEAKTENEKREKAERARRVQLSRELREQEERSRGELRDDDDDGDQSQAAGHNPFRPINAELATAQSREAARKQKTKLAPIKQNQTLKNDGNAIAHNAAERQGATAGRDELRLIDNGDVRQRNGRLPSLSPRQLPKLNHTNQYSDDNDDDEEDVDDDDDNDDDRRELASNKKRLTPNPQQDTDVNALKLGAYSRPNHLAPLGGHLEPLEPGDGQAKQHQKANKKKKKKFHLRRNNQTAPFLPDEPPDASDSGIDQRSSESPPLQPPYVDTPRVPQQQPHGRFTARNTPLLDRLAEDSQGEHELLAGEDSDLAHRWNIVDDLPELPDFRHRQQRLRPNSQCDDDLVT